MDPSTISKRPQMSAAREEPRAHTAIGHIMDPRSGGHATQQRTKDMETHISLFNIHGQHLNADLAATET